MASFELLKWVCFQIYVFHVVLWTGNTVLIVAHASSLEACTRQMQGLNPQNAKDFVQVVRKVSYTSLVFVTKKCFYFNWSMLREWVLH